MKKKPIKYAAPKSTSLGQILQEPEIAYEVDTSRFSCQGFADLSSTLGFSQAEWASILHISDRTLQRYLKEDRRRRLLVPPPPPTAVGCRHHRRTPRVVGGRQLR
ncbi:MAG TPA: antitoxin Xre-like helix-turn-helix domain-containing protein, partial [Phnomibacter sp.]|nr:antitoxin Xre-like helix-turn-helix domain-containing protein [Phnomibacter sp.]